MTAAPLDFRADQHYFRRPSVYHTLAEASNGRRPLRRSIALRRRKGSLRMSTTFPITVTVDRLVEFHGLADALCLAELGRLPTHNAGDPVAEIIKLKALQGE